MNHPAPRRFARRMHSAHKSFIREILKVTEKPEVISFAGGLPNPEFFDCQAFAACAERVLSRDGAQALQYSATEGYAPLREWIAQRYRTTRGMEVNPDHILVTTGSQQCLDLAAKVLVDPGDTVVLERPGYLGAIQAFSLFEPRFVQVEMDAEGVVPEPLEAALALDRVRLFNAVTSFQNPSGLTYSLERRQKTAELIRASEALLLEDDPYGELRFEGETLPPAAAFCPEQAILLGSFSKIAAPGFRLGWLVAPEDIYEKLVIAKQAADLHTSTLTQRALYEYLSAHDLDAHVGRIKERYRLQRDCMVAAIKEHFPPQVAHTEPEGGMFLWVTLPPELSSMDLLEEAVQRDVAFVPGAPFYVDGGGANTLRLNFSNSSETLTLEGIKRLGSCLRDMLAGR
ncbi:MAG: PLP-dependent aminotransferase family protein [Desulfovibrionaceae bacterium]